MPRTAAWTGKPSPVRGFGEPARAWTGKAGSVLDSSSQPSAQSGTARCDEAPRVSERIEGEASAERCVPAASAPSADFGPSGRDFLDPRAASVRSFERSPPRSQVPQGATRASRDRRPSAPPSRSLLAGEPDRHDSQKSTTTRLSCERGRVSVAGAARTKPQERHVDCARRGPRSAARRHIRCRAVSIQRGDELLRARADLRPGTRRSERSNILPRLCDRRHGAPDPPRLRRMSRAADGLEGRDVTGERCPLRNVRRVPARLGPFSIPRDGAGEDRLPLDALQCGLDRTSVGLKQRSQGNAEAVPLPASGGPDTARDGVGRTSPDLVEFDVARDTQQGGAIEHARREKAALPEMTRDSVFAVPRSRAGLLEESVKEPQAAQVGAGASQEPRARE